jgi:hypothetical protein
MGNNGILRMPLIAIDNAHRQSKVGVLLDIGTSSLYTLRPIKWGEHLTVVAGSRRPMQY